MLKAICNQQLLSELSLRIEQVVKVGTMELSVQSSQKDVRLLFMLLARGKYETLESEFLTTMKI